MVRLSCAFIILAVTGCHNPAPDGISLSATGHVGMIYDAQEAALKAYIKEDAWIGLTKRQLEHVLEKHGFPGPYQYGAVYQDYWGEGFDEALYFPLGTEDLWILIRDGKVALLGTIYRE